MVISRSSFASGSGVDSSGERWRVFCAVGMPEPICTASSNYIKSLRTKFPDAPASWNRNGVFHLTLKFLGSINQPQLSALSQAAARAVVNLFPFKIVVKKTGTFPKHGPPRVLWLGIDDVSGGLAKLQASLEYQCEREGFAKEERPFHPHITLARIRRPQGMRGLAVAHRGREFGPIEAVISELFVFRSELKKEGSEYSVISRHPLTG